jgi:hypothetical protein
VEASRVGMSGAAFAGVRTVVFRRSGRLGNQLFQYAALRAAIGQQGARLLLVDLDELAATFDDVDARFLSTRRSRDRAELVLRYRMRHLRGGALGKVRPDRASGVPRLVVPGPIAEARGYYQAEHAPAMAIARRLTFRTSVAAAATAAMTAWFGAPRSGPVAFVAVRRGDFLRHRVGVRPNGALGWVDEGLPVALGLDWYERGMTELRDLLPGVRFLVVTDDPAWSRDHLAAPDVIVSGLSAPVDLALMAQADAGVLSASSFGWWGARFAADRAAGPFLAPEHWLGHRIGGWWPPDIAASHLTFRSTAPAA